MRVLLLTLCYLPDGAPNASVMAGLSEGLRALGHEILVITAFPHYGQSRPYIGYGGWRVKHEANNGIQIARTPLYVGREDSPAQKVVSWLSFNLIGGWAAARAGPADVIITPSPPPTLGLAGWLLGCLWGVPYIYNPQDIYPDVAVEQGFLRNRQLIALLRKVEDFIYAKAGAITVLSESHRANLMAKEVHRSKVVVIPNLVDTDFIRPLPRHNPWSARHGLDTSFVVTYAGNISASQGVNTLIDAASLLRKEGNILFLVIARGTGKSLLEAQARSRGLNNIRFLPFQRREFVPHLYASADAHLVLLRRGIGGSFPSKTYSIMGAGRPLLAAVDENSEVGNLIQRTKTGIVVPPEDPQAIVRAILSLAEGHEARHSMGERGRNFVLEHHSKRAVALRYDALIRRLAAR